MIPPTFRSCFISAGEPSGDLLAADLVRAFHFRERGIQFEGLAGHLMQQAGVRVLWPLEKLSAMGLIDVLKQAPRLRILERNILARIDRNPPDLAILVDYPGFHFRLAEQLKLRKIPVIQYVAPKVWAWGASRVSRLKRDFELVLGILPFEKDFFIRHQVPWHYVGCPHLARIESVRRSRRELALPESGRLIACLPGSRMTEVRRILPVLARLRRRFHALADDITFAVPVAGNLPFQQVLQLLPQEEREGMCFVRGESLALMKLADLAIVASGTATLECALAGTPMLVVYLMDALSYRLARRKVRIQWVSLVNLCLGREAVPEYIQEIDEVRMVEHMQNLLAPGPVREKQLNSFRELRLLLGSQPGADEAAKLILRHMSDHKNQGATGEQF